MGGGVKGALYPSSGEEPGYETIARHVLATRVSHKNATT